MFFLAAADEFAVTSIFDQDASLVTLSLSGEDQHGGREKIPCISLATEGKRLLLQSPQRLSLSVAANVEYDDAMFLGEVMSCTCLPSGFWLIEFKVEHMLTGLLSLMALRSRLLGDSGGSMRVNERDNLRTAA